jgi:hypothetical protein
MRTPAAVGVEKVGCETGSSIFLWWLEQTQIAARDESA